MVTLTHFTNSQEILQRNVDAAKDHGVYAMSQMIGNLKGMEKDENIFSNYNCFGAICGRKKDGEVIPNERNNPSTIHMRFDIQINPETKQIDFISEGGLGTPNFTYQQYLELEKIITQFGYMFGVSNSIFANA